MKGPDPIPIPDDFTLEWYIEQKEHEVSDKNIADSLYISYGTLHSWKQKIGWVSGNGSKYWGRKPFIDKKKVIELRATGLLHREIAEIIGCSVRSVIYILRGKRQSGGLANGVNRQTV